MRSTAPGVFHDYCTSEWYTLPFCVCVQCLKVEAKEKDIKYYVHYSGWNKGWAIHDLHARGKESVTYDILSSGAFQALFCTKKICKISISFVWVSPVHKPWGTRERQPNEMVVSPSVSVHKMGSTVATSVMSLHTFWLACKWSIPQLSRAAPIITLVVVCVQWARWCSVQTNRTSSWWIIRQFLFCTKATGSPSCIFIWIVIYTKARCVHFWRRTLLSVFSFSGENCSVVQFWSKCDVET